MGTTEAILKAMRKNPRSVRFADLAKVCDEHFGPPRRTGGSHRVYRTPWPGDPRVNIQDSRGMAKADQVRQVLKEGTEKPPVGPKVGDGPPGHRIAGQPIPVFFSTLLRQSESCRSMATNHYTYRIIWSPDDGEHVGLCSEFPSLSWLAPTTDEAMTGIRRLVNEVATEMQAAGEQPPTPTGLVRRAV